VIVVEHDEEAIRSADHIIDIGPGAGVHGGRIVAEGSVAQIESTSESLTGKYLSGKECIAIPEQRVPYDKDKLLHLNGARGNNLQGVDLTLPLGLFTCITGVSGSGKSTLINNTLYPITAAKLHSTRPHSMRSRDWNNWTRW
jgi:excinuclease ABC subunit A